MGHITWDGSKIVLVVDYSKIKGASASISDDIEQHLSVASSVSPLCKDLRCLLKCGVHLDENMNRNE